MQATQLEFELGPCEYLDKRDTVSISIEALRESHEKLRKGLFKRYTDTAKRLLGLSIDHDYLSLRVDRMEKRLNEMERLALMKGWDI
jgi:hypothetical protein